MPQLINSLLCSKLAKEAKQFLMTGMLTSTKMKCALHLSDEKYNETFHYWDPIWIRSCIIVLALHIYLWIQIDRQQARLLHCCTFEMSIKFITKLTINKGLSSAWFIKVWCLYKLFSDFFQETAWHIKNCDFHL